MTDCILDHGGVSARNSTQTLSTGIRVQRFGFIELFALDGSVKRNGSLREEATERVRSKHLAAAFRRI
jgi:hypothetical protein